MSWKINIVQRTIFLPINIELQKGYKSKLTSVVKSSEGRLGEANFMTVRDYGSTSPSCCDISHHCQFSHFRVRPAGYSSSVDSRGSCWMKEDRDIYGQRKQISQLPVVGSTSVDIDHWWPSFLFMTCGFLHLCQNTYCTVKYSKLTEKNILMKLYLESYNTLYGLNRRSY